MTVNSITVKKSLFLALLAWGTILTKTTTIIVSFSSLFEPNETIIEKHIRNKLGVARSIGLFFSGIPTKEETKREYFEILNAIPTHKTSPSLEQALQSPYFPWEKEYAFPKVLRHHVLTKTAQQEHDNYEYIVQELEKRQDIPTSKKRIYLGIIDFNFQNKNMNPIMQPITPMVNLLRSLKKQGYQLILIGNVPGHAWHLFLRDYPQARIIPEIFKKENIFISGIEGVLAQSEALYKKILTHKKLTPHECLVIDSHPNNLNYPQKIGMKTITFNTLNYKFKSFNTAFQKLLISKPKEII